jgi:hypothetical protein
LMYGCVPKGIWMTTRRCFGLGVAASVLMLVGQVVRAQTVDPKTATTAGTATISSGAASERQSQLSKASASGKAVPSTADARSLDSAHASDSAQKKHLAGVKYEDRSAASPGGAPNGEPQKTDDQGVGSKAAAVAKPHS